MNLKILKQEKNPFLHREQIIFEIKSNAAPSSEEVKKAIGKDEELVVIKKIKGNFGTQTFTADVFIYDNPEAKKRIEVIPKKIKKKLAEETKQKAAAEVKAVKEASELQAA